MGVALSVVAGTIGAVELLSCLHYISDEWLIQQLRTQDREKLDSALVKYQSELRRSISELERRDSHPITFMQDGIAYENGYRQDELTEESRLKFEKKLKEILRKAHIGHENDDKSVVAASTSKSDENSISNDLQNDIDMLSQNNEVENASCESKTTNLVHDHSDLIESDGHSTLDENELVENDMTTSSEFVMVDDSLVRNELESTSPTNEDNAEYSKNAQMLLDESLKPAQDTLDQSLDNKKDASPQPESSISESASDVRRNSFDDEEPPSDYSEEYLRALDGVKNRPLVRDDGTGRRRAFKKRNSSSSSSQERRLSREEELKAFTSLEEEEFQQPTNPIKYSNESRPKKSSKKSRRRHKKLSDQNISELDEDESEESPSRKSSIEKIDELTDENVTHPWGDIKPEMRRETVNRNLHRETSIDEKPEIEDVNEEFIENEKMSGVVAGGSGRFDAEKREQARIAMQKMKTPDPEYPPKIEEFEEATQSQHDAVVDRIRNKTNEMSDGEGSRNVSLVLI